MKLSQTLTVNAKKLKQIVSLLLDFKFKLHINLEVDKSVALFQGVELSQGGYVTNWLACLGYTVVILCSIQQTG